MTLHGLFITGTDTNVGKTIISCMILQSLRRQGIRVGAYKPACSGAVAGPRWEDIELLHAATGRDCSRDWICPQAFHAALAPPMAAILEGRAVDSRLLRTGIEVWKEQAALVVIEGAGGLFSPLTETESNVELAVDFGCPMLIVARAGLGTINHTLLTIEAAERRGLRVAGVILNAVTPSASDESSKTNGMEIARRSGIPVLGTLPYCEKLAFPQSGLMPSPPAITMLQPEFDALQIDWQTLAGPVQSV